MTRAKAMRWVRGSLGALACGLVLAVSPTALRALEAVDLTLRNGPEDTAEAEAFTELLRAASLTVSLIDSEDATSRDIIAAARSDYTRLVEALFSEGHYSTVVRITVNGQEVATLSPLNVPDTIERVVIKVDPGPQFRFGRAEIGPLAEGTELPEGFAEGAPARAALVRTAAGAAITSWRDLGYPKASISGQSVVARHNTDELDVSIEVTAGPRLRFGSTNVRGETDVRANRVRQIAGLPKGEFYSPEAVEKAGARLRRTGTFRSARLIEGDPLPDGTLDMEIVVVDRAPRQVGAGAEVSTDNGLTLTGFWLHRNILGGAESLRFEAEIRQLAGVDSAADYVLGARFERPAVFGPDTRFFAEADIAYYDEPDFLIRGVGLGAGFSREITDTLTVESGLSLSYLEVTDRFLANEEDRELLYLSAPTKAVLDTRDDALDARTGYYVSLEGEPFVETLESETGIRVDLDARLYTPLGAADRLVIASRFSLGTLIGPEAEDAPPGFLYYSGGGGSVRGQPYQSLDIDYGDAELGGRSFTGLSSELRYDVTETIGGVVFLDSGLLSGESDFSDLVGHAGAGVGLRYKTPVGPIRLDIGAPVAGDTGRGVQMYIGIGQAF